MAVEISIKDLKTNLEILLRSGLVPMIRSSPGIGKTSVARLLGEQLNLKVIDIRLSQCDPTDLNGFPSIKDGKASYVPMDTFPLEGEPLPVKTWKTVTDPKTKVTTQEPDTYYKGWLIIYDEITSAVPAVQAACYKILLEKEVGQRKLHPNVFQLGLGNKETDNAVVARMSTALQSRLSHITVKSDPEYWCKLASNLGYDYRVIAFINHRPEMLNKFNPKHNDHTFPCERTWEFTSKVIKGIEKVHNLHNPNDAFKGVDFSHMPLIAAQVGEGAAAEFIGFCSIFRELIPLDQIIRAPSSVPVPQEPATCYALAALIGEKADDTNITPLMEFINRMPIEFQILTVQMFWNTKAHLRKVPAVSKWQMSKIQYLMD